MDAHLEFLLIETIVIVLAVSTLLAYLFQWIRLPAVLGFILAGIIIGPYGLGVVKDATLIKSMAQIGILFLLFIVGLELSIGKIKQLRFHAPIAGILQLGLTTAILTGLFILAKVPAQLAFLLGSILSLSSTALVLKNMEDIGEIDTVHGRLILGILIIQDISMIPLMTLVPAFTNPFSTDFLLPLLTVLIKALFFVCLAIFISFKLVPNLLDRLASSHSKEVFTLSVVTIGLGMAFLTGYLGLSYEAGAFIAGLSLSGSLFSRQIVADSRPFRDVFATLFFVSVGLLINLDFLTTHLPMVLVTTTILILIKALMAYFSVSLLGFPRKVSLWVGFSIFQVGEFSFVLLRRILETTSNIPQWQTLMNFWSPLLINAIVLSMFITPIMIRITPWILYRFSHGKKTLKEQEKKTHKTGSLPPIQPELTDRVIIAGYGPIAQNLSGALSLQEVPYVIVEMNANTVKKLQQEGKTCYFGDISHPEILKGADIEHAKILAITFPDLRTTEVAIQHAKQINPNLFCIARARYRRDIEKLFILGADEVIYDEFESSVSFIFNTLHILGLPVESITPLITLVREKEQKTIREIPIEEHPSFGRFNLLADTKIEWVELKPKSPLVGKSLLESKIRQNTGVNVLSIINLSGEHTVNPDPDFPLKPHDVLIVVGTIEQLHKLEMLVA